MAITPYLIVEENENHAVSFIQEMATKKGIKQSQP